MFTVSEKNMGPTMRLRGTARHSPPWHTFTRWKGTSFEGLDSSFPNFRILAVDGPTQMEPCFVREEESVQNLQSKSYVLLASYALRITFCLVGNFQFQQKSNMVNIEYLLLCGLLA